MLTEVIILHQCEKELKDLPDDVFKEFLEAVTRLSEGIILSMPLSKSMSGIHHGLHELRLKDKSGIYRIFYFYARMKRFI